MDPEMLKFISDAFNAGVLLLASKTVDAIFTEPYQYLKTAVLNRFKQRNLKGADLVVKQYEEKPEAWKSAFEDLLEKAEADSDSIVISAAERMKTEIDRLKPEQKSVIFNNLENKGHIYAGNTIFNLTQYFGGQPEKDND